MGASWSHVRCWEEASRGDNHPAYTIILEDDCCIPDATAMRTATQWLSQHVDEWDLVLLGWVSLPVDVNSPARRHPVSPGSPLTTLVRDFYGAHAYAVTRGGARRLYDIAFPLEVHVDHFLAIASMLQRVRGYAWHQSLANQCTGWMESSITHIPFTETNVRLFSPDVSLEGLLVLIMLVVLSGWLWTAWRR